MPFTVRVAGGIVVLLALLAGCALRPGPPGSEVRAVVIRPLTAAAYDRDAQWRSEAERRRDAATGLRALAAQGRVLVTRCALSGFEVVFHLAVLPPGAAVPENGALLRVRLGDAATADAVLGMVTEAGVDKGAIAVPGPGQEALVARHYHRIRGVHLLACTPRS